ncbi:galactose-binding domain-containing protein [Tieghemostelium lacteum]|uniref:Nuclear receptor 2C2-associated protein n=1 Tax=Tieghemostelium lacteum TaxID=361077 RepID=A0A151ZGW7_TIELA|nr:galactose-binding domain-containing protein [Tieghemostelium lacteum]|eukprot:KYQ93149.1 galactose-binding domain-containing protein [Tieghemostelium lacteum]
MTSLLTEGFKCRVSSVLNKNTKEYGKDNMFDKTEDTCWNSHQGTPQFVVIQFPQGDGVKVTELQIMFQGGFVGKDCEILFNTAEQKEFQHLQYFYPKDINTLQSFPNNENPQQTGIKELKIIFPTSTDFFGRITIYKLDVL